MDLIDRCERVFCGKGDASSLLTFECFMAVSSESRSSSELWMVPNVDARALKMELR